MHKACYSFFLRFSRLKVLQNSLSLAHRIRVFDIYFKIINHYKIVIFNLLSDFLNQCYAYPYGFLLLEYSHQIWFYLNKK